LLIVLAIISFTTGDARAGTAMSLMVILGVSLRFVQEARADTAAAKLKAMITLTTAVVRAGKAEEIPLEKLAPGDVVTLCAGDMIPADVRIISAKDLFVSQATLTGESLPVEKFDSRETREEVSPLEFSNTCFLGTSVESGAATAVVVATGADLLREHGQQHCRRAGRDKLRQRNAAVHLADDPLHDGDGASGFLH
jgi:Mg2+-importing ATPase